MTDSRPSEQALERAASYLAGAMTAGEVERLHADLDRGDAELAAALRFLAPGVEALADACAPATPDPGVRDAVLDVAAGGSRPWQRWSGDQTAALFTLRADEGDWEETGVEGVQVRRLFVDRAANRMTGMFRMAPGTSYPSHVHDGPEECMVLEGDLHVGEETVLRAGDYQRAAPGSEHVVQWTEGGCLLLVSSSLSDEMV